MNIPPNNQRDTLKDYVQKHPNNKMAWYLLGRDYMERGEQAKAQYCFIQAGEVYVAYEANPAPEIVAAQQALKAQQEAEARAAAEGAGSGTADRAHAERARPGRAAAPRRGARRAGRTALALVLLLLVLGPAPNARGPEPDAPGALAPAQQAPAAPPSGGGTPDATAARAMAVYFAAPALAPAAAQQQAAPGDADRMLAPLIREALSGTQTALLVQPSVLRDTTLAANNSTPASAPTQNQAGWLDWLSPAKVLYGVEKTAEAAGAYKLSAYDKEQCVCEPGDPSAVQAQYNAWKAAEEQRLIVRSAWEAYSRTNGKPPESAEALVRSYPNNVLPGLTAEMAQTAGAWLSGAAPPPQPTGATPSAPNAAPAPQSGGEATRLLQHPLEIVVDKATHRLAIVSGSVILRSYPVGLGGPRTPEGEFAISEKVRNPNGKDNGEFGSRGMTLSDTNYAIHGTNQPTSIGEDRSLGCIRMLKGDVEELFDMVPKGTKVTIGRGLLPADIRRAEKPFQAPPQAKETNPGKVYRWLN
ncbi:L,D-transpeptidase [Paenibacillus sp. HJGM_3]|uniref:L,D-transpeptidase n=1 Tax=Paenibacillus sp. HJGM_3 TaxID=3379816 RepID=UPI0038598FEC